MRQRAKLLYMAHEGHPMHKIATELNLKSRTTIYKWITRWQEDGLDGLRNANKSGRPSLMSEVDYEDLTTITVMEPRDFGLKQPGWTVEALNQVLREKTSIIISDKSLRDVLHRLGYSFQLVRPRGQGSIKNLPRTPEEFELYMLQLKLKAVPPIQSNFSTWTKTK